MSDITIHRFEIAGYRSINKADLDFTSGSVGLIGPNTSGKTNIGRAILFFCDLIKKSLPNIGGAGENNAEMAKETWSPIDIDPNALLYEATAGKTICLKGTFRLPPHILPDNQGIIIKAISRSEPFTLAIEAMLTAKNLVTGQLKLVPQYTIEINGKGLLRNDVQVLQSLWQQFEGKITSSQASSRIF